MSNITPKAAIVYLELFVMDEISPPGTMMFDFLSWLIQRTDTHKEVAGGVTTLKDAQKYILNHAKKPFYALKKEHPEYFQGV